MNRIIGATSFKFLRTHNNITYDSYKEAAISMGLIKHDSQITNIFEEACHVMLPFKLRKFFAWFLISDNIQGTIIWEKYKQYFLEDFKDNQINQALVEIN